jgi:hypothetical protein
MNALLKLWAAIAGLADSLTRTKELVDASNGRIEQALGLDVPPLKMIDVEPSKGRGKKDA